MIVYVCFIAGRRRRDNGPRPGDRFLVFSGFFRGSRFGHHTTAQAAFFRPAHIQDPVFGFHEIFETGILLLLLQDCVDDGISFNQQQCSEFDLLPYKNKLYEWEHLTTSGKICIFVRLPIDSVSEG